MALKPAVLLYDWDNTLVDAWAGVTAALNVTFSAFGMPPWTNEDTNQRVRVSLATGFQAMFGDEWRRARDLFQGAMRDGHLDHLQPMPGAAAALVAGQGWPQRAGHANGPAAGVTAVLLGDAAHDGGVRQAAPDLHFASAEALAARLRALA